MLGTNCPISSGANYTYKFQTKGQIGTFTYFPFVAANFGALNAQYEKPDQTTGSTEKKTRTGGWPGLIREMDRSGFCCNTRASS